MSSGPTHNGKDPDRSKKANRPRPDPAAENAQKNAVSDDERVKNPTEGDATRGFPSRKS